MTLKTTTLARTLLLPLTLALPLACATTEKKVELQQVKQAPVPAAAEEKLAVKTLPEEVGLPRTGPLQFESDSDNLSESSQEQLFQIANYMLAEQGARITIEGHCDERGSVEYNLALGDRRATVARDFLKRLGVSQERVEILSFGEERPAEAGADEESFAKNRRDEFRFVLDGRV